MSWACNPVSVATIIGQSPSIPLPWSLEQCLFWVFFLPIILFTTVREIFFFMWNLVVFIFIFFNFLLLLLFFTLQYCIGFAIHQHASAMGVHVFPILNHPPSPSACHPSGSSQCTSPKLPVSCIEPGLAIRFLYDIIHVLMPFSQIIPPSLSHRV